jgi:hypothetical protein
LAGVLGFIVVAYRFCAFICGMVLVAGGAFAFKLLSLAGLGVHALSVFFFCIGGSLERQSEARRQILAKCLAASRAGKSPLFFGYYGACPLAGASDLFFAALCSAFYIDYLPPMRKNDRFASLTG